MRDPAAGIHSGKRMIAHLDRALERLLLAEIPVKNGEIDVKFEQPTREWSARLSRPVVNLFLYDVRENNALRQPQWERIARPDNYAGRPVVSQKRTPFRIDCHYILTTWATEAQDEHMLLSRAMLALFRYPFLPEKYLGDDLREQPFKLAARLAAHDKLTNPTELWNALDNDLRPSVSYVVTLAMDPWAVVDTPAVLSFTLTKGQTNNLPHARQLTENSADSHTTIGGIVRQNGRPQPNLPVALKGTGFFTTTDEDGRYTLANVPLGQQTIVAWTKTDKPAEKPVVIPGGNYDIEI